MITTRPSVFAKGSAATNWSSHTSLFLKKDGGAGEGKNFSSREKKVFPFPRITDLYREQRVYLKSLSEWFDNANALCVSAARAAQVPACPPELQRRRKPFSFMKNGDKPQARQIVKAICIFCLIAGL